MMKLIFLVLIFISQISLGEDFRERLHHKEQRYYTDKDIKVEVLFGRELAVKIVGMYPLLKDEQLTKYINLIGKSLAVYSNRPEIEFHFGILDTDEVNALSTPGGYIFITKGCLKVAQDESEIAGILAHEIGHVSNRHILRDIKLKSDKGDALSSLSAILKSPSAVVEQTTLTFLDEASKILFERGYRVEQEYEADKMAVELTVNAGYDPYGLVRFLQRVKQYGYSYQMEKTHPSIDSRIDKINATLIDNNITQGQLKTSKERYTKFKGLIGEKQ